MNKLQQLINQHCPNGVEFKTLGEVCEFQRGTTITAKDAVEGDVPVIAGGQTPAYYHNVANRTGETISVSSSGAYAGFVAYWTIPVYLSDSFSVNPNPDLLLTKYVFYFLKNIQEKIHNSKKGSGVPHVHGSDLAKFPIPLPPLPVQLEIVNILDKFTELEAELEAELEVRKKQYEYYRCKLLTFDEDIQWKTMSEIFEIKNGYTPSKANQKFWEGADCTLPWFRMEDIRENGRILSDSIQHITPAAVKGKLFPANSIIVATSATIGEHALILVESLSNQRFTYLTKKGKYENALNMKFFYYYMFIVDEWCKTNIQEGNFANVDMPKFRKFKIPIPPLAEQSRIVAILDKFDALVNDISIGLPAEIKARRQQYEYYRNKLLTFKEYE